MMYQSGTGFCPYCGSWLGGSGTSGLLLLLFGALVVAGIVLLVVWAARAGTRHQTVAPTAGVPRPDDAVRVARERFAKGEITQEEYENIVRALGG